jgi:hypothetical protein
VAQKAATNYRSNPGAHHMRRGRQEPTRSSSSRRPRTGARTARSFVAAVLGERHDHRAAATLTASRRRRPAASRPGPLAGDRRRRT